MKRMFDVFQNRLEIIGTLTTVTAIRVGAGRSIDPIGTDLPVMKDALGQPLIPGSSFKGALRSRVEAFLRGINPEFALDPSELVNQEKSNAVKQIKERHREDRHDADLTRDLMGITDLASQVFGAPWLAGKVQIRDLTVVPGAWFGQYQERDGVGIDRDTETASGGAKYDFQVVPAGTPFQFQAVMENAEDWQLGLLVLGLNQFEQGQVPLGGARSRGLGVVELVIQKMRWVDVRRDQAALPDAEPNAAPDPESGTESLPTDPQKVLQYLQRLSLNQDDAYADGIPLRDGWVQALITFLTDYPAPTPTNTASR
jgi:CRISPR-associated RAMP protein (TIGR02581 family)